MVFLAEADYTRFLKKNRNLSKAQQKEINDYFSKENNQAGATIGTEIGWQSKKIKNMSYDDFLDIMIDYKSGRRIALKAPKIKGKKNEDFIHLKIKNKDFLAYIPLNWKTAKFMNTDKFGVCQGDWCIGSTVSSVHWKIEVIKKGQIPIYLISRESKWVVMINKNNKTDVWSLDNDPNDIDQEIPGFNINRELFTSSLKKLYDEVRQHIKENELYPDWLKEAEFKDEELFIDNSGQITWESGIWIKGVAKFDLWKKGTWNTGWWSGGHWKDGLWKDGTFTNGDWEKGQWHGGIFKSGTWWDGVWYDGEFDGGTWKKGKWLGGEWKRGKWEGGYDKDGMYHKLAPPTWEQEDLMNLFLENYKLTDKQQGMEGEFLNKFYSEINLLIELADRKLFVPIRDKMFIEVKNKNSIKISDAVVTLKGKNPFGKGFHVEYVMCEIKYFNLDGDTEDYSFNACSIDLAEIKFDAMMIMQDCTINGGIYDTTDLGNWASDFSAFHNEIEGGVWVNHQNYFRPIICNKFSNCSLTNYVPEGKMFEKVSFYNCLIDIDKIDNMTGCIMRNCEFTDKELVKNYGKGSNTIIQDSPDKWDKE